jgi:subtilase family protein
VQPADPDETRTPWEARAQAQAQHVMRGLRETVEPRRENGYIRYFVRRDYLLVREERAADVRDRLGAERLPDDGDDPPLGSPQDGAVKYGYQWVRLRRGTGTFRAIEFVLSDEAFADVVAPEYFLYLCQSSTNSTTTTCPADEPSPVPVGTPPDPSRPAGRCAGEGVKVVVIDTGLDHRATTLPWMSGVTGQADPGVNIQAGQIGLYAGHGTFIAGLVRSMAPRADVHVRAAFTTVGMASELELVTAVERSLIEDEPDIINLSAGTLSGDLGGPKLLNGLGDHLRRYKGVVLVVAAGNDRDRRFFWPAASPWTVSVGALGANWRGQAHFSNFGGWVDVYAPGEHLVNAFPSGTYRYQEPPLQGGQAVFSGMARWSGTSFAAPVVAGLIAARMSCSGEHGRDAAAALLARARAAARPGIGAVLVPDAPDLTCEDHTGDERAKGSHHRCGH